ncbi:MAG: RecX family transcriptional regulator [Tannerella sp.]|jgi:regulatory protein|nr:RecX family transcriptional regulator [Tannerella sp.]
MKSEAEVLAALAAYCSQAERCLFDLRRKIRDAGLSPDAGKRIIRRLSDEKFVDESRFVRAFVNDKFRFNHWGRIKIAYELKIRDIKPAIYEDAISGIDDEEYMSVLRNLLVGKRRTVKSSSPQDLFAKLMRFASSRGFETPLIVKTLKIMIKNVDYD